MTDADAIAYNVKHPHISAETAAYYAGRNAGEFGGKCGFTKAELIAAWKRGVRSVRAEIRLDNDTEWDEAA
jgi:hypothetical protein